MPAEPNAPAPYAAAARSSAAPQRQQRPRRDHRSRGQLDVLAAVAAGGVVGAEARYATGLLLPHPLEAFPWSTLLVNALGCLLIGVLMVSLAETTAPHRLARPFLGVGVLGGFTTFSTYAVDVQRLLLAHRVVPALAYLVGTVVAALLAVWLGATATRSLVARARRARSSRAVPS